MNINDKLIKEYLKNVYFINGTAYAGKSTVCKALAEKYHMIHCEENYKFNDFLKLTTKESHPNMHYFQTKKSWEEFVTRDVLEYEAWLEGVSRETTEFEILELISLSKNQKVIVDTNIPVDVLKRISDEEHVLLMLSTTEIAVKEFFERPDKEKQFLLNVIKNTKHPNKNLAHFKEVIAYANRQEKINQLKNSGFQYIERKKIEEPIEEKIAFAEKVFKLA